MAGQQDIPSYGGRGCDLGASRLTLGNYQNCIDGDNRVLRMIFEGR
jgi:hypothetical protein